MSLNFRFIKNMTKNLFERCLGKVYFLLFTKNSIGISNGWPLLVWLPNASTAIIDQTGSRLDRGCHWHHFQFAQYFCLNSISILHFDQSIFSCIQLFQCCCISLLILCKIGYKITSVLCKPQIVALSFLHATHNYYTYLFWRKP